MNSQEILAAVAAGESQDWEFKSAKGGFPANVWETYAAMANTDGGTIVLGVGEANGEFSVEGLRNPEQALKTCWDTVNNRGKVSVNLLATEAARLMPIDGKQVLVIQVPRADRRQRPVFVGLNPLDGTLRRNYEGAVSECRNPSLQRMFQLIGAGDKAGSGIDKIRRGWETQQWRSPTVSETTQPDRVKFVLPMVSLIPAASEARLRKLFGPDYDTLTPIEVQTLVTADLESEVSNSRLQLIRMEHPVELTKMLQGLASRGFLDQIGQKRGTSYRLPAWASVSPLAGGASPRVDAGASALTCDASALAPSASALTGQLRPLSLKLHSNAILNCWESPSPPETNHA